MSKLNKRQKKNFSLGFLVNLWFACTFLRSDSEDFSFLSTFFSFDKMSCWKNQTFVDERRNVDQGYWTTFLSHIVPLFVPLSQIPLLPNMYCIYAEVVTRVAGSPEAG